MMKQESLKQFLAEAIPIARELQFEEKAVRAENLLDKLNHGELLLAFVGSTSAGKSTVINNLLNSQLLPVSAIPTTGVMTLIRIVEGINAPVYAKVNFNKSESTVIAHDRFVKLSRQDADDYYLLADVPENGRLPVGTILMDVPGYNSLRCRHDAILEQWLPQMDRVVWVINAKLGVHQSDSTFFRHAKQSAGDMSPETLMLLVNLPTAKFMSRMDEIKKGVMEIIGTLPEPFTAMFSGKKGRHAVLDLELFHKRLQALFSQEQRQEYLYQRIYDLSVFWLEEIRHVAELTYVQKNTDIDNMKKRIEERIQHVEKQKKRAADFLTQTEKKWQNHVEKTMEELDEQIWVDIESAIEKGSTLSAKQTVEHVSDYVIPDVLTSKSSEFITFFESEAKRVCNDLETILMDDFSKSWAPDMQPMDYDPSAGVDNTLLRNLSGYFTRNFLSNYLSRMGGRAGGSGVVGIMNLSRKGMGWINKAGKALGRESNVFGKTAMNKVGGVLKRFGLTTSRAVEGGAFVAIEAISFIYDAATWRHKLRSKLAAVLKNEKPSKGQDYKPVYDLNQGLNMLCGETLSEFKQEVDQIIGERLNSLYIQQKCQADAEVGRDWEKAYQRLKNLKIA